MLLGVCFDKSNNGLLDVNEMKHVLTRIGDVLSPEEIENLLKYGAFAFLDNDGDEE